MRGRATYVPIAALAAVALVSACSDTSSRPTSTTSPSATHGAFGDCLRSHGVSPVGPPSGPPAGVDQHTWDDAMQACGSLAPSPPGPTG